MCLPCMLSTSTISFSYSFFSQFFFFFFSLQTWACEWQVSSSALQPSCFCLISCRQVTVSNHPSGSAVPRGAQASLPSWSTSLRAQAGCTFLCSLVLANTAKWERGGEQLKLDLCILREANQVTFFFKYACVCSYYCYVWVIFLQV